jgi:hypothetical protein
MAYTFRLASAVILSMVVGGCGGDDTTNPIVVDSSTPVDALADTAVLDSSAIADASDAARQSGAGTHAAVPLRQRPRRLLHTHEPEVGLCRAVTPNL